MRIRYGMYKFTNAIQSYTILTQVTIAINN